MANFSWSDSLHAAFRPCLACLHSSPDAEDDSDQDHGPAYIPRARADELEGLLADVDTDDAETLSLHSNMGDREAQQRRRRKGKRHTRSGLQLFGFYLFGRPPIHLPEDDEDEGLSRRNGRVGRVERARTISASTLDSDASPLDPSTIDELSAARLAEAGRLAQEQEEERVAKEERRRRRRERKERKKAELARALSVEAEGGEFEGFPGSGSGPPLPPSVRTPTSDTLSSSTNDDFGPYQDARARAHDQDDADADFGAGLYAKRMSSAAGTQTGSDSRSRTSGSRSTSNLDSPPALDAYVYNHHYLSQQQLPTSRSRRSGSTSKSTRSSASAPAPASRPRSHSHSSTSHTSQSPSLSSPAPLNSSFPAIAEHEHEHEPSLHSHSSIIAPTDAQPVINGGPKADGGFPSTGLGAMGMRRKNSEAGVFLARRGDD